MSLSIVSTPIFTTRQYAFAEDISIDAASRRLKTLEHSRQISKLVRGIWIVPEHPHFSFYACVPFLLSNEDGYISFLSSLHLHGALSQIPKSIQVATTGHSRSLRTSLGVFEFFQMHPRMMADGVDWSKTPQPFRIATIEKALLDTLYLSTRRGKRFAQLPEVEIGVDFRPKKFAKLVREQVPSASIASAIQNRFGVIQSQQNLSK